MRNAGKRKKRSEARASRLGLYRLLDARVAIAIYIISGYDMGLACEFVQHRTSFKRRQRKAANWVEGVTAMFLKSSVTVKSVLQPEGPGEMRVVQRAVQWLAERGTREWVKELNFEVGRASQNST